MDKPRPDSWFLTLRNPLELWELEPSFLSWEILGLFEGFLTFCHAWRHGGRWWYLWWTILLHGLVVEMITYNFPEIDNFWHAQGVITLLGQRLPLAIVFLYPTFLYTASVAISNLNLPWWGEPFGVGLLTVLMDVPYDITGIKCLWWSWHDTDPSIYDRFYWVPWTSFYFHASFASALTFLIHGFRKIITKKQKYETDKLSKEWICVILTSLLATPLGVMQFIPVYHPLHDYFGIHSEVCVLLWFSFYALTIWTSATRPKSSSHQAAAVKSKLQNRAEKWWQNPICILVTCHYIYYIIHICVVKPENVIATGVHEPIGNCHEQQPVYTPLGMVLSKRKYLCLTDYDETYFDFHCLPNGEPPKNLTNWYTQCGTPFPNPAEYRFVVSGISCIGLFIYSRLLLSFRSNAKNKVQ